MTQSSKHGRSLKMARAISRRKYKASQKRQKPPSMRPVPGHNRPPEASHGQRLSPNAYSRAVADSE